jgi:hypothetical protein
MIHNHWLTALALVVLMTSTTAVALATGSDGGGGNPPGPGDCAPGVLCFVAPFIAGLPPMELPPGVSAPPQTTILPGATLPPVLNSAEDAAVSAMTGFGGGHPSAPANVSDSAGADSFSLNVSAQAGANFYSYTVPESATTVQVSFVVRDGTHSQVLAAFERSTSNTIETSYSNAFEGGLADARFDNDLLTSLTVTSETAGQLSTFQYPVAQSLVAERLSGSAASTSGLGSPADLDALNALVAAHLDGPAKDLVLSAFHSAQDEYAALSATVPEPGTAALLLTGIALAGGWSATKRRSH